MFDTENIPVYIDAWGPRQIKDKQGNEINVIDLTLRIEPITPVWAAELGEDIKGTIFRRNDAEVWPHIAEVRFNYKPKPQEILFRPDPKLAVSLHIDEAKIANFRVRKPKDGNHLVLLFRATVAHLSGAQLLYIQDALYKQFFLTFANATHGLFDDEEKAERKARGRAATAGASAAAH